MKYNPYEKELGVKVKCPECGEVVHCAGCCDYICPNCGADLDDDKKSWPEKS